MKAWRALYGASAVHLLAVLACLALAGVAVVELAQGPAALKIALWSGGAVLLHDLALYPLYTALDRGAGRVLGRTAVNFVRVPALLSGLLLLLFWPVVTQHSEGSYSFASGLDQDVFLGRYLAVTAVLFAASGLLYVLHRVRSRA
ncbi:MAG: Lipoprotein [Frankiales bacterium]|nr:Lipoprotein [Frankiales bacterium]